MVRYADRDIWSLFMNDQYPNGFFEGFIRGTLMVPSAIPIIWGMEVGQVDFGLSSVRNLGCGYRSEIHRHQCRHYWGGDVSVGFGKDANAKPTFPNYWDVRIFLSIMTRKPAGRFICASGTTFPWLLPL
jgi:hypothetical protein